MTRMKWLPDFPAYATPLDKLGWWALRGTCAGVLLFLLLPILVIIPLSFAASKDIASWLEVHQTVTLATVAAPGHLKTRVTPGYSVVVGLNPESKNYGKASPGGR